MRTNIISRVGGVAPQPSLRMAIGLALYSRPTEIVMIIEAKQRGHLDLRSIVGSVGRNVHGDEVVNCIVDFAAAW